MTRLPHHLHKHTPRRVHPLRRLTGAVRSALEADRTLGTFPTPDELQQTAARERLLSAAAEAALAADCLLFFACGHYETYQEVF